MDLVLLQETKWDKAESQNKMRIWKQWERCFMESIRALGVIGVIWNPLTIICSLVRGSQNWMVLKCKMLSQNREMLVVNVYGPILTIIKRFMARSKEVVWIA